MNNRGPLESLEAFKAISFAVAAIFSMQLEVLIRRNFGERYFSLLTLYGVSLFLILTIIVSAAAAGVANFAANTGAGGDTDTNTGFVTLWFLLFAGMAIFHRYMVRRRKKKGEFNIHSYFAGDSYSFWYHINRLPNLELWQRTPVLNRWYFEVNEDIVQRFFEPLLFFIIGLIFLNFLNGFLGLFMIVCSFAMLYKHQYQKMHYDAMVLDEIDNRIESQVRNAMVEGRLNPRQLRQPGGPRGTPFAKALAHSGMNDEDVRDTARMRSNLSPELQRFTQPPGEAEPVTAPPDGASTESESQSDCG